MRSPARKRSPMRIDCDGGYSVNVGPIVHEATTYQLIPLRHAIKQRGVYVDARWGRGGRDKPDWY